MKQNNGISEYRATRYACYAGIVTQSICNNLAPLLFIVFQLRYGLSYEQLGFLVLLNFVTQLAVDLLCVRYAHRMGYRVPLVAAQVCSAAGLLLMGALPLIGNVYAGLCAAVLLYAVGGGLLEVLVSPVVDALPAPENGKAASMALLHSFYCWGQLVVVLVSTVLLLAVGQGLWWLLPIAWSAVPVLNALNFVRVPLPAMQAEAERTSVRTLLSKPLFFAFLMLMICAGASEQTVAQWASMFAEQALGVPKMWGDLLGPCLFALMMATGRMIYGVFGERIDLRRFMLLCGALCVACYLTLCFAPHPALALFACALSGFSVSIFWPGTCSMTSARFPAGGAAMFAMLAACGDIGCAAGPWLAGAVAERAGGGGMFGWLNGALFAGQSALKTGILLGTVFPLALLLTVLALRKRKAV